MKTQNYHIQDGAIHNGYAHIASLALIDLIAEANKRLDSRVTPEGARGIAEVYKTIKALFLAPLVLASRCPGPGSINAGSHIPGCPKRKHWACSELIPSALITKHRPRRIIRQRSTKPAPRRQGVAEHSGEISRFRAFDPGI